VISKPLSRRLERLEAEVQPSEHHVVVIHVVGVNAEGERVRDGPEFRVPIRRHPGRRSNR
jgi:hypothetical protein